MRTPGWWLAAWIGVIGACDGLDGCKAQARCEPRAARRWLNAAAAGDRWEHAFAVGEACGRSADLSGAAAAIAWLEDTNLQQHFWDGYAHSAPWEGEDPAPHIARIRQLQRVWVVVPLEDGVIQRFTERNARSVDRVVDYAERWSALTRRPPVNGVRVGLQHALGDSLPDALAVAATYPAHWQPEIFEELGWRAAVSAEDPFAPALLGAVPTQHQCWFVHGAVRGAALHASIDAAAALNLRAPVGCQAMGWHAIGVALRQSYPDDPAMLEALIARHSGAAGAELRRGYSSAIEAQR